MCNFPLFATPLTCQLCSGSAKAFAATQEPAEQPHFGQVVFTSLVKVISKGCRYHHYHIIIAHYSKHREQSTI